MFKAEMLPEEYARLDPASVRNVTKSVAEAGRDLSFITLEKESFEKA